MRRFKGPIHANAMARASPESRLEHTRWHWNIQSSKHGSVVMQKGSSRTVLKGRPLDRSIDLLGTPKARPAELRAHDRDK